jgi:ABC-2 type transport system permease protein
MSGHAVWTIALKDLRLLLRDPVALFWVLVFPVLFAVFFGAVLEAGIAGKSARWPVVLVDEAHSESSEQLVSALSRADALTTQRGSLAAARRAVAAGRAVAYVRIVPGASGNQVEVDSDASQRVQGQLVARLVEGVLAEQAFAQIPEFVEVQAGPVALHFVAGTEKQPGSSYELVFPAALLWGLMGCAASFAVSLVAESTRGTMVRLRAAPIARGCIMGGKALACLLACTADGLLLWLFGAAAFGIHVGNPLFLLIALLSTAVCFVGMTMTLGSLGRSEQSVASAGWSTLIVFAMLGGAMVPRSLMPPWLQQASQASPVYWAIRALEGASWRSAGAADVLTSCAVLLGVGLLGFALGVRIMGQARTA